MRGAWAWGIAALLSAGCAGLLGSEETIDAGETPVDAGAGEASADGGTSPEDAASGQASLPLEWSFENAERVSDWRFATSGATAGYRVDDGLFLQAAYNTSATALWAAEPALPLSAAKTLVIDLRLRVPARSEGVRADVLASVLLRDAQERYLRIDFREDRNFEAGFATAATGAATTSLPLTSSTLPLGERLDFRVTVDALGNVGSLSAHGPRSARIGEEGFSGRPSALESITLQARPCCKTADAGSADDGLEVQIEKLRIAEE